MGRHSRRGGPRNTPGLLPVAVVAGLVTLTLVVMWPSSGATRYPPPQAGSSADATASTHASGTPTRSVSSVPNAATVGAVWLSPVSATTRGYLSPGSRASALPYPVLIADKLNNRLIIVDPQGRIRWQFPRPGDLAPGQTFRIPDDAFFSADGRYIVATEEDDFVITVIDIARHRITYRYGTPGRSGLGANQLDNPDDAMMLPNGTIITADIKNCRLLLLAPPAHVPLRVYGTTTHQCVHRPPTHWGSPNGAFPLADGNFLITEINGDWVNEMSLGGTVLWSTHPPGVSYPSDTNQVGPNRYLTVDFASPGRVVEFDRAGHNLWTFTDGGRLNYPSLALPLPNGDVLVNDDSDHRVIVIDPHTDTIVWQYGHTGVAGTSPGYLDNPDGVDLVPPQSLLAIRAAALSTASQPH